MKKMSLRGRRAGPAGAVAPGTAARAGGGRLEADVLHGVLSWGPTLFPFVLVASVFVAGLMAIVQMVRTRRVIETLSNLAVLVQGFLSLRVNPEISLDNPVLMKLPFGVAVAAGTLICICAARWGL